MRGTPIKFIDELEEQQLHLLSTNDYLICIDDDININQLNSDNNANQKFIMTMITNVNLKQLITDLTRINLNNKTFLEVVS